MIQFEMPMRTVNPLNNLQHWRYKSKRANAEKLQTTSAMSAFSRKLISSAPAMVTLTRISKRKMDTDGLAASFKHVRDSVAKWLGCDDGDETKVLWHYAQEIGKEYGVRVEIK